MTNDAEMAPQKLSTEAAMITAVVELTACIIDPIVRDKMNCCLALELFCCLPLWKTVLFVSSRAFSLSTPVENSEATWKKATKCNKEICP